MDEVYKTDTKNIQDKLDNISDTLALKYKNKNNQDQTNIKPFLELASQLSQKFAEVLKVAAESS